MSRPHVNVGAMVPDVGGHRAQANLLITWDEGTDLADQEAAIKEVARAAIRRVREEAPVGAR